MSHALARRVLTSFAGLPWLGPSNGNAVGDQWWAYVARQTTLGTAISVTSQVCPQTGLRRHTLEHQIIATCQRGAPQARTPKGTVEAKTVPMELEQLNGTRHAFGPGEHNFLKACKANERIEGSKYEYFFLDFIHNSIQRSRISLVSNLHTNYHEVENDKQRAYFFLSDTLRIYQDQPDISINHVVERLVQAQVFSDPGDENVDSVLGMRQCIFSAVGISTSLYLPIACQSEDNFEIDRQDSKSFCTSSISIDLASRPIDELLRSLGAVLPRTKGMMTRQDSDQNWEQSGHATTVRISHLNAYTLNQLAGVKIVWTDSIGAHLMFDSTGPAVHVFRTPSVCKLHNHSGNILSTFTQDLYEGDFPFKESVVQQYLNEVLQSYHLLFCHHRLSRKLYRRRERCHAAIGGAVDPVLDEQCGMDLPTYPFARGSTPRDAYDMSKTFPILSERLTTIQDYMSGIEPNRVTSLWKDRRDLRLWYTIWAVLIIGGISIILAFVSVVLSGLQVSISSKALQIQQANPNDSV